MNIPYRVIYQINKHLLKEVSEATTGGVLLPRCFFRKFHRKTPMLESLFIEMFLFFKKRLQHGYFPVKFAKFFGTLTIKNIWGRLLLEFF